ncbi:MAG: hypothetical protein ACO1NW_00370 [Chitinophagaceae bacterium]
MKEVLLFILSCISTSVINARVIWGANDSRTESRDNAGLKGNACAKSGFFETAVPIGYPIDPDNPNAPNVTWNHLLDIRHSNLSNNFSMQFAGNFFTHNLYFRKTIGNPDMPWSRVLIEREGKVRIGTTNPKEALQIGEKFVLTDGGWKTINYNLAWKYELGGLARMKAGAGAALMFSDLGNIVFATATTGNEGTVAPLTNSLIIHNSGQVGIGTSTTTVNFSDQSSKLFVEGGIRSRKVKVDQVTWADHVFGKTHRLMPLKELEVFIQQNKHLPGIPTEESVKKEGQDIGEMNRLLLEKVEELTLHLIEMNKRLEMLERENVQLKISNHER